MSTTTKGLIILFILLIALYNNIPTLEALLPQRGEQTAQETQKKIERYQKEIASLTQVQLVLAEAKKNRIQLMGDSPLPQVTELAGLKELLAPFAQKGDFLVLKNPEEKKVFISKVAKQFNAILTEARKIQGWEKGEDSESIILKVAPNKRMSDQIEPLKSLLAGSMDLTYSPDQSAYILRKRSSENIVNLGLDLQGGMYQDIGVDTDTVVESVLKHYLQTIEDRLLEDNINYDEVRLLEDKSLEVVLEADEQINLQEENWLSITDLIFDVEQQGSHYRFTLTTDEEKQIRKKAVDQALETIRNRIDQLGVKEPSIQRHGDNSIIIQLPGLKDPEQARRVISQVAVLEFMLVAQNGDPNALKKDQILLFEEQRDPITKEVIQTRPWVLENKVLLQGNLIRDARVGFMRAGDAFVSMSFDDEGTKAFAQITTDSVGRQLAIVLDNKVQSAPRINEPIQGGEAQITGNFSPEEASELALVLRSGALPAPIIIHEERTVGASLGDDSIRMAMTSLVIGFGIVIFFMILYYQLSGIFSVLALLFNLVLIVAVLAYFGATLTLPGMAGIVLTIGMAVDANVLIFERIREEMQKRVAPRRAINLGFQKATMTILDANITTILAAIILFQFGTGPIKGFAVTLSIGIVASMFTAIFVSRFLFEVVYLRKSRLEKISI